jgi:cell division protein FtsI (penicillin-binding protein 3)
MAPLDNPQIVVAVVMDEPKVGARDGGMVSAPVFKEIAQNILQEMKVATDAPIKPETLEAKNVPDAPEKEAPDVGGTDKKSASTSPDGLVKPKGTATPGKKNIAPGLKKTNDKKLDDPDKITARSEPGTNRRRPVGENKTKVET